MHTAAYFRSLLTPRRLLLAMALGWPLPMQAGAPMKTVVVYSTNVPPFHDARYGGSGAVWELLQLAAPILNVKLEVRPLPFKRQSAMLSSQPNTLALMWRLQEVEGSRVWMVKLLSEQLYLVARRDSAVNIDDLAQARGLRVGVLAGGPAETVVRQLGFTNLEAVSTSESNARKLALGRIDAWAVLRSVAAVEQQRIGSDLDALRFGSSLQRIELYLTCSPGMAQSNVEPWRQAFERLRRSGRYQQVISRYHLSLPSWDKPHGPAQPPALPGGDAGARLFSTVPPRYANVPP